jgi:hypothetical protein
LSYLMIFGDANKLWISLEFLLRTREASGSDLVSKPEYSYPSYLWFSSVPGQLLKPRPTPSAFFPIIYPSIIAKSDVIKS